MGWRLRGAAGLLWCVALSGCMRGHEVEPRRERPALPDAHVEDDAGGETHDAGDASDDDGGTEGPLLNGRTCQEQIDRAPDGLPDDLACTGLYTDVRNKVISPDVRLYAPAVPLWSDGAGKQRWIHLPPGTKIDASNPAEWVFPIGTKFFKEFRAQGRRIETRLFQKVRTDRWVRTTYEWNRGETRAIRSAGGDRPGVRLNGVDYHIPSERECDLCHGGREDRILGFEAISLGLPAAQGITLRGLVQEDLLEPAPARTELSIGDDGTGVGAPVMAWLHVNCGVSCHNDNQNSEAYSSGLRMKLYPNELDGRPSGSFDAVQTTVGVRTKTKRFGENQKRITPGTAETSILYRLASSRGTEKEQMPPIASKVVSVDDVLLIRAWIEAMEAP